MMSLDDKDLFRNAMEDVAPLKDCANVFWLKSPPTKSPRPPDDKPPDNPLVSDLLAVVPLDTTLEYKAEGIQQGVLDKLRLGKYSLDASLNLRRLSVEHCRQSLYRFMLEAQQHGLRNLLIIHGKGRDDRSHANIIRSYVSRWLQQFPEVQAFCCARPQHGGSGACYVGLRKSEQARQDNRERHAKRCQRGGWNADR